MIDINPHESWGISTCLDLFITLRYECKSRPIQNSGGSDGGLNWRNQDVTASPYIFKHCNRGVFIQRGEGIGETVPVV